MKVFAFFIEKMKKTPLLTKTEKKFLKTQKIFQKGLEIVDKIC